MPISMTPRQILRPVSNGWISLTFIIAFTLNFIPWNNKALTIHPDFILLLLIYWCSHQPRKIGLSFAFLFGLVMDIADANVFGQHALAYVVVSFLSIQFSRRLSMQNVWQQAAHVFILLLLAQVMMVLLRMVGGASFIGLGYFVSSLAGALLWPLCVSALQLPQRRAVKDRYESSSST
ncbi:rod shape-determining protein MreD [Chitinivorax tropicus]|uniref:Rod shape-determining protein MreD n=1 Tax=Chitinivorax tropicus TaxID=714531 RepID=A0A840MMK9_9PROT|nr:rod shape-determining protein MreD [Chitinivorax tropicus]MBB5017962.1 rod shape-determining protein MreD [Chitinivorax tropicus]